MINVKFYKAEATGNDFIIIDNRKGEHNFSFTDFAKIACNRYKGVGADGLLLLEQSDKYDFKMRYLNSDGSEGSMCGNGGRAISKYASTIFNKNELRFLALNYVYYAFVNDDIIKLFMKNPEDFKNFIIEYNNTQIPVWFINTGAPHTVVFWENVAKFGNNFDNFDLYSFGKFVRFHNAFGSEGTNVDLISIENNILKIRTYEKGVENETLSCGTGALAGAIIAFVTNKLDQPIIVIPKSKDFIKVGFSYESNKIKDVYIEGKANIVFKGELVYDPVEKKIFYKNI